MIAYYSSTNNIILLYIMTMSLSCMVLLDYSSNLYWQARAGNGRTLARGQVAAVRMLGVDTIVLNSMYWFAFVPE